jgi:hypothetical protein
MLTPVVTALPSKAVKLSNLAALLRKRNQKCPPSSMALHMER